MKKMGSLPGAMRRMVRKLSQRDKRDIAIGAIGGQLVWWATFLPRLSPMDQAAVFVAFVSGASCVALAWWVVKQ